MKTSPLNHHLAVLGLTFLLASTVVAQNFTLSLQPSSVPLIPTKTATLLVSLTPTGGFTSQVALATGSLPAGVTAQFSPNPVAPPGTSLLTLSADTNAAVGTFTLDIIASGGCITNSTASSVTVNFGLLPLCAGAFEGTVTDAETGLPVTNAYVQTGVIAHTDAAGHYVAANLGLAADNTPQSYGLVANAPGYWSSPVIFSYAICNVTNTVNFQILRKRFGSVSGTVISQSGQALSNVTVGAYGPGNATTTSDSNGAFQLTSLSLYDGNAPVRYTISGQINGYWQDSTNTTVAAGSNSVVQLVLVPVCSGTLTGRVVFADTGLPAPNVGLDMWLFRGGTGHLFPTSTDTNGAYHVFTSLDFDNTPLDAQIVAHAPPGYQDGSTTARLTECLQTGYAPVIRLQPVPKNNYGAVTGHIWDLETGLPVTNAWITAYVFVGNGGASGVSDSTGAYFLTNVFIGTGSFTNRMASVTASAKSYFQVSSNVLLVAGQIATQDVRIVRIRYGAVTGVVRDSATHLPIAGATVQYGYGITLTGPDGHYTSGPIPLSYGYYPPDQTDEYNIPITVGVTATARSYFFNSTSSTITANTTNTVDIELLKVCGGATLVGNVVNALTQQPIPNATVSVDWWSALTDTNGNFILTNIAVGNFNAPLQRPVTASAPGFNSQSHTVTLFCGGTITVEFGATQTAFGAIEGYATNALTGAPLTNVFIGSEFGGATSTDTNGYYRLEQAPLGANGAPRTWTLTAMPDGFPPQTKSVVVSSNTVSRLDFGFGQPPAFLVLAAKGAPDPVDAGSNLLYTITLTNEAAEAANVQLLDTLPPNVTFLSASITNRGMDSFSAPAFANGVLTTTATRFGSNSLAVLSISVRTTAGGTLTNVATVTSDTPDLDTTGSNHLASVVTPVSGPAVVTNVSVQVAGPMAFNRQTGLFEQPIQFNNLSGAAVTGVRISLPGLPADLVLYNASGSSNGEPFIEYDQTVAAGGGVSFILEYYRASRLGFAWTNFTAVAVAASVPAAPEGTTVQLDRDPFLSQGKLVIEFASTPGATYVVQYSADLLAWKTARPPIVAAGTRVQWVDGGPPETESPPGIPGQRYYRIVRLP